MITPAISVLGAIQGVQVAAPALGAPGRPAVGCDPARSVHPSAVRVGDDRMVVRADSVGLVRG